MNVVDSCGLSKLVSMLIIGQFVGYACRRRWVSPVRQGYYSTLGSKTLSGGLQEGEHYGWTRGP